jgi:hypothetical protein
MVGDVLGQEQHIFGNNLLQPAALYYTLSAIL